MINAAAPMMGGMICPPVEVAASTAPANSLENPSRFIIGMVNTPSVTVLATDEPEMVPNKAEDTTETFAGPPARPPRYGYGHINKELPQAGLHGEDAKEDEMENESGHNPQGERRKVPRFQGTSGR